MFLVRAVVNVYSSVTVHAVTDDSPITLLVLSMNLTTPSLTGSP